MTTEETNLTLSESDVQDIAAYYRADCTIVYSQPTDMRFVLFDSPKTWDKILVEWQVLGSLQQSLKDFIQLKDFKLHLKPISTITDEQLYSLFNLVYDEKIEDMSKSKIDRYDNIVKVSGWTGNYGEGYTLTIDPKSGIQFYLTDAYDKTTCDYIQVGALIRQLQRWGFHVPGTIRPELVTLKP